MLTYFSQYRYYNDYHYHYIVRGEGVHSFDEAELSRKDEKPKSYLTKPKNPNPNEAEKPK